MCGMGGFDTVLYILNASQAELACNDEADVPVPGCGMSSALVK